MMLEHYDLPDSRCGDHLIKLYPKGNRVGHCPFNPFLTNRSVNMKQSYRIGTCTGLRYSFGSSLYDVDKNI